MEQGVELLSSIRKINKRDAERLLANYGSINDIVMAPDYRDFTNLDGIAEAKIESLLACFRGKIQSN